MRQDGGQRRRRPFAPHRIDRIGLDGDEAAASPLAGTGEAVVAIHRLQPGVEAQPAALGQVVGDPLFGRLLGNLMRHESRDIDLVAHRERVASVDENGRAVRQHDGETRRAAEAGEPSQPL